MRRARHVRRAVAIAVALSLALATGLARAEDEGVLSFGTGLVLAAGVAGFGAPGDLELPDSGERLSLPAFSGPSGSGGVSLELRALEIVGLEVSAIYTLESLGADTTRSGEDEGARLSATQPTFRVPIGVKGLWPIGRWSPFLVAGPELVFFGLSEVESDPRGRVRAVASTTPGVGLFVGAGVEWRAPVEGLDLRIPLGLRVGFDPGGSEGSRATALPSDAIVLDATPSYRVEVQSGAALWF